MPKISWKAMMDEHPAGHLVVAIAADSEPVDAAKLLARLFMAMALDDDYALNAQPKAMPAPTVECVFAQAADAKRVAVALGAKPIGKYPGWASQRELMLDRAAENRIATVLSELG